LIALLSVLVVALVNARASARDEQRAGRAATDFIDALSVSVLSVWRFGQERALTMREYVLALGRRGGHLNRNSDGLPGWQTLWRGAMKLHAMIEYELSRRRSGKL
jgi:hypothetical protein